MSNVEQHRALMAARRRTLLRHERAVLELRARPSPEASAIERATRTLLSVLESDCGRSARV